MYGRFTVRVCAVLLAASLSVEPAAAQVADRAQLGVLGAGDVVTLPLDRIVPPTRLLVEIDGRRTTTPLGVSGTTLSLTLPDDLVGARHDIVVFEVTAAGTERIGTWEFETADGAWDSYVSVLTEIGIRSADGRQERYASGGGRVDFDLDDGRFRGGLSFGLLEKPDGTTGDRVSVGDWFLESRTALAGDTLRLRLGSHYFDTDSLMFDEGSRRGVSARLVDPAGGHDSAVFALQTTQPVGTDNLTGLADPDDRVAGVVSRFRVAPGSALRATVSAYGGTARDLPNGLDGAVRGQGFALSGPLGPEADFLLSADRTEWRDAGRWREGHALRGEANVDITPTAWEGALTFTAEYDRVDDAFHAPLNPALIAGEEVLTLGLNRFSREWDWGLEVAVGRTNTGGPAQFPVDRLTRVGLDATYAPEVFTGGFLNGTSFFAAAEMLRQDRISSPAGSAPPADNTIWSLSLGMDRFQPDHSFALLYTYDVFEDRSGSGLDETIHGIEGLVSFTPNDRFDASFSADLELSDGPAGRYWLARGSGELRYELVEDRLAFGLALGFERTDNPAVPEGGFVDNELVWEFSDSHALVLSADYGRGSKTNAFVGETGWLFGVALRSDFSAARYR